MKRSTRQLPAPAQWLLSVLALFVVGLVWWGFFRGPEAPALPPYTISEPEMYGNPGPQIGNKFMITIAPGTPEPSIRQIVQNEAEANREKRIIVGEGFNAVSFRPGRMLFQVIRSGSTRDVVDYVYEWERGLGTRLESCPPPVETDCREDD